jgi:glycosyltransferase involved in cell wall biosynthesis
MLASNDAGERRAIVGAAIESVGPTGERKQVLVVGQTPPPYGGQAMMIEHLVQSQFERIQVHHIRLAFSSSMDSVGRAELRKVFHLIAVLARAVRIRLQRRIDLLWFSPAGPNAVPVLRDIVLLGLLRRLYPKVVLHFHAAGVSEFLQSQPSVLRRLAQLAYGRPEAGIQTSGLNPPDASYFAARQMTVIANGIPDEALGFLSRARPDDPKVRVLYVGKIEESKGIMILLESVRQLRQRNHEFTLWLIGQFGSTEFERKVRRFCSANELDDVVEFKGQRVGADKWEVFHRTDILCFPSFFESESFGNVALEGMMFQLPVVATRWRGIPDLIDDGENGLLVPVKDPVALASALDVLINDRDLRRRMGAHGRDKYLARFTIEKHLCQMEAFLCKVASS